MSWYDKGSSLLAAGITQVQGDFHRGELVSCIDSSGQEIARGLVLGFVAEPELIHRDNLVLIAG